MDTALERVDGLTVLADLAQRIEDPQAAVAIAQSVVQLQQSMERFNWERQERQYRIDFDTALNECQAAIGRIAPNQQRTDSTKAWWADYNQLDDTVRPVYTASGFSIAFSEVPSPVEGKVRERAELSRMGVSKEYFASITPSTTGAKGNAMVNQTDADAIARSRCKRYLLLDIFNIAVGIDKIEKDISDDVKDACESMKQCKTLPELKARFKGLYDEAKAKGDKVAKVAFVDAYDEAQKQFLGGAK